MNIIFEGIDNIGKGTIINALMNRIGFHQVIKYSKPGNLDYYHGDTMHEQAVCYELMFNILAKQDRIICDRAHLGEYVYSDLYRSNGDKEKINKGVFTLEKSHILNNTLLVLLTTSDMNIRIDDGQSFDHNRGLEEQNKFIEAFENSSIENKIIVDVCNGSGRFKDVNDIIDVILEYYR